MAGGGGSGVGSEDAGEWVTVACTQMACSPDSASNVARAEALVRAAVSQAGAHVVLLQELFETPYFCQDQDDAFFALAKEVEESAAVQRMCALAKELGVVLPVSFFERAGNAYFNSCAVIDADGSILGVYRKSHIPDGPGYQEKYYFSPGDTGFRTFRTRFGVLGVGVCWDQWFPEAARCMALQGAEILFYPTAIGSEPHDPSLDSRDHWRRTMQGHAAANLVPVVASNRVGVEPSAHAPERQEIRFYGNSFITDATGEVVAGLGEWSDMAFASASFHLGKLRRKRAAWGLFRDRRPTLYGPLLTMDGRSEGGALEARRRERSALEADASAELRRVQDRLDLVQADATEARAALEAAAAEAADKAARHEADAATQAEAMKAHAEALVKLQAEVEEGRAWKAKAQELEAQLSAGQQQQQPSARSSVPGPTPRPGAVYVPI